MQDFNLGDASTWTQPQNFTNVMNPLNPVSPIYHPEIYTANTSSGSSSQISDSTLGWIFNGLLIFALLIIGLAIYLSRKN